MKTFKKDSVIRARINSKIKDEATAVLTSIGLTPSAAFSLLMTKIAVEKSFPFELLVPNDETIQAIRAARAGLVTPVSGVAELFDSLDEE